MGIYANTIPLGGGGERGSPGSYEHENSSDLKRVPVQVLFGPRYYRMGPWSLW